MTPLPDMNHDRLLRTNRRDDGGDESQSESQRYRALADDRRRLVLDALADFDAPVDLDTLAVTVRTREVHAGDADDVRITLHHVHLPMLDDAGFVDYDPATGAVEATKPLEC